jgi:Ca2+:H+ antiporter
MAGLKGYNMNETQPRGLCGIDRAFGHPMNLVFSNPLELIAVVGAAFTVNSIAQDGETTWFEGMLLIAVYTLLALTFFFAST